MPEFTYTRGDEVYKITAADEAAAAKIVTDEFSSDKYAPETTAGDVGRGAASGLATGAVNIVPGVGALAADIAMAPGRLLYKGIDLAAGLAGYDTGLEERYTPGGAFGYSAKSQEASQALVDRYLIEPPKSSGGKLARAVTSAGVEALGGSGLFKVAATGQIFSNADDAARAAETAIRTAPGQSPRAALALKEAGEAPLAQAAYSAAAGGGGELAEQQGLPPIVGSLLGVAGAAAAHTAPRVARAGAAAIEEGIEKGFLRTEDAQRAAAAEKLRSVSKDPEALQAWTRRAQDAEDAFAEAQARGADAATLERLDAARREAHGELVAGSRPTLYEATDITGIGHAERDAFTRGTGEYRIEVEENRAAQNQARVEELRRIAGEGSPQEILTEFRRQRDAIDADTAAQERTAQAGADVAAQRAGTTATAEAVGEGIRGPLVTAQRAAKAEGNRLYEAIGAEGITVGTGRLKAAIARVYQDIAENPLSAVERQIADLVKGYGPRLDFTRLEQLRSRLTAQARDFTGLNDVERRRAKILRNAIDEAMDDGLARAIKDDPNLFQRVADTMAGPAPGGGPLGMRGRRGAERPKPKMPLSEFIARHGGLPLDAESAARDWGSVRVKGRPLAHPGGRGIDDYWRETLMEEGYLPYDYDPVSGAQGTARNVDDEVRRLLEEELHGGARPDLGAQRPLDGPEREMADARALIADRIKREGIENPSPTALDEAARMLVEGEERHPTTAYERAVTQGEAPPAPPPGADVPFEGGGRVEPPIDEALTAQQREARRHWRENVKEPYQAAPVKGIVQEAPTASGFKMTEAAIPETAFVAGNKGGEAIRALRAAGATNDALAEAAALSFSDPRRGVMRDGAVDPNGFRRWLNNYGPAIAELPPEVQRRFSSAAAAAAELIRVTEARTARLHDFDQSAVGKVLGIPVENLSGAIRTRLENPAASNELARAVAGNPAARAGLQRLVADHILSRFTDASDVLSKASLTKYVKNHEAQLRAIFGDEGAERFRRVAADIERSRRQLTTGKDPAGPSTAADLWKAMGGDTSVMTLAASLFGAPGVAVYGIGKHVLGQMHQAGITSVEQLYARALLDPDLARQLLARAPALKSEKFLKGLGKSIARSSLAGLAYGSNQ